MSRNDLLSCPVQISCPSIVAQPLPELQHRLLVRRRQMPLR